MNYKLCSLLLLTGIICTITALAQPHLTDQGTIGGSNSDVFTAMCLTNDGGLIVGGYSNSNSSAQKTQDKIGSNDYWVVKLDSNHKIEWDKTFGGNSNDYLYSLQQTTDGGYILGGYSSSVIGGDKTEKNRGSYDYWVVKIDANGAKQWDRTIGGSSTDFLYSLQQTTDGGYILGGYSVSEMSGEKTENSKGFYDYWVVKLNANGTKQWDRTIGGDSGDFLYSLQQTTDGGYILGGYSYSGISGEKTEKNRGRYDYWVVKLNANGAKQWDKTIGGYDMDYLRSLQQTTDGGYILGGYSYSGISGEKTEDIRGSYDYWVVKLHANGAKHWDKTIGGSDIDYGMAVQEIKRNQYVIGGYSYSGISGDKTGGNRGKAGTPDYWIVKLRYEKPAAIAEVQNTGELKAAPPISSNTFTVAPNPAKGKLNIQSSGKATYILTNTAGKTVATQSITGNGVIHVAQLPAGVYYLKNTTTGDTQKIVIAQ